MGSDGADALVTAGQGGSANSLKVRVEVSHFGEWAFARGRFAVSDGACEVGVGEKVD